MVKAALSQGEVKFLKINQDASPGTCVL